MLHAAILEVPSCQLLMQIIMKIGSEVLSWAVKNLSIGVLPFQVFSRSLTQSQALSRLWGEKREKLRHAPGVTGPKVQFVHLTGANSYQLCTDVSTTKKHHPSPSKLAP